MPSCVRASLRIRLRGGCFLGVRAQAPLRRGRKQRETRGKTHKLSDNGGLYLLVTPSPYRRRQWLIQQGFAEVQGTCFCSLRTWTPSCGSVSCGRWQRSLSKELGLEFDQPVAGEQISGICRRRVDTSSGSYGLVERSREFSLVPWRPELERVIGREISGRVRGSGGISWTLGRERSGPEIGW